MTVLFGLQTRLTMAQLYVFADGRRIGDLPGYVRAVVAGGADLVEVRLHGLTAHKRQESYESVRAACAGTQAIVVIDHDVDVAAAAQADALVVDGNHVAKARTRLHQWALVGQHVGTRDELATAASREADFAVIGPVVRGGRVTGLLDDAVEAEPPSDPESLRWFADGGVATDTVAAVLDAGARRIGVGAALLSADDPEPIARRLKQAVAAAWQADPSMEAIVTAAVRSGGRATLQSTDELRRDGLLPDDAHPGERA